MIYLNAGSVCPSEGYLLSEQEKTLFKALLANAKNNLKVHSLTKKESGMHELI